MHEMAIASSIASTVERHAGGAAVACVRIDVGHLRQVVPDSLAACWEMLTEGTALAGAPLEINEIPAAVTCAACGAASRLRTPLLLCPACGSAEVTVTAGDELLVRSLDLVEA